MKVALYARVSTTGKGQDVDLQLRDLRGYVEGRKMQVYREYVDPGFSGRKDKRPALDLLMDDARKKKFDVVMVWRFDRFARSTRHLVTALEEFKHLGVDFVSYMENIDTSSPMGKAMFAITSAIAELEVDLIRERVKAGLANAMAKGVKIGRPSLMVDEKKIVDLRGEGFTIRGIADRMNLKRSFVHKTLSNHRQESLKKSGPESGAMTVR
jgi:DNA invertase Pin-like site-specific DNA recombinase